MIYYPKVSYACSRTNYVVTDQAGDFKMTDATLHETLTTAWRGGVPDCASLPERTWRAARHVRA